MSGKLAYERYVGFHRRIHSGRHPNAASIARRFEISVKQAQRDISFMRDRLFAPLSYNAACKGYEYEETGYELPPIWFHEDELLSFCLALRLASTLHDRSMKSSLSALLEKFLDYCFLPDHRLDTVYSYLFSCLPDGMKLHRALDDARLVAGIWRELGRRLQGGAYWEKYRFMKGR